MCEYTERKEFAFHIHAHGSWRNRVQPPDLFVLNFIRFGFPSHLFFVGSHKSQMEYLLWENLITRINLDSSYTNSRTGELGFRGCTYLRQYVI